MVFFLVCLGSMKNIFHVCFLLILLLSLIEFSFGQVEPVQSSPYYVDFPGQVTSRYYFSRKYTSLRMTNESTGDSYVFEPNSTLNMGLGATYSNFTLNLAFGFGFLNPDKGQGDTKYLDLQAHMYPKNFIIDFFGQFYNGYHVEHEHASTVNQSNYYQFPDMKVRKIGASVQYMFNGEKLSLRAAFLQNEWQKRSAASLLLGFEMYGGQATNEGGILSPELTQLPTGYIEQARFFEFGPNVGYAGTLVIKKHFFLSGSVSSNIGLGYISLLDDGDRVSSLSINPNLFLRGFAGYNSDRWSINANYVFNNVRLPTAGDYSMAVMTGNYRMNFIYRFLPGPKISRHLRTIDKLKGSFGREKE